MVTHCFGVYRFSLIHCPLFHVTYVCGCVQQGGAYSALNEIQHIKIQFYIDVLHLLIFYSLIPVEFVTFRGTGDISSSLWAEC